MSARPVPCRGFEDLLAEALDLDGRLPEAFPDAHAASCPACAELSSDLAANTSLFLALARPEPAPGLLARLARPPEDIAARREAARVLGLLSPGELLAPEPSTELMGHLSFLPARRRTELAAAARASRSGTVRALGRLFGDWRVTVAFAYAATLLLVTILKVDPLSVARGTAGSLTSAGERAIAEAREVAEKRLNATPLTARLDYRLYRTLAASRARAAAYSQLLFEKVFGGGPPPRETGGKSDRESREPFKSSLRS